MFRCRSLLDRARLFPAPVLDEARKHIEKAIVFLQPLGDTAGMRDARALLATLHAK